MNILYVSSISPFSRSFGGQIRTAALAKLLKSYGEVQLALIDRAGENSSTMEKTRAAMDVVFVEKPQPRPVRGVSQRLSHEFSPWCLNSHGRMLTSEASARLGDLARRADLVWVHGMFAANSSGIRIWPNAVLDIDDVPSLYYASQLKAASTFAEKAKAMRRVWYSKRREKTLSQRFKAISVCSERDKAYLDLGDLVHVIPNGFGWAEDCEPIRRISDEGAVGFVGTMEYEPNREGVTWFLKHVWPSVLERQPSARLRLVGAGSEAFGDKDSNVDGLGFVDDVEGEMATWNLSIVPIRVGGGTRIKIAEAFSRKIPVVSTSLGAYGYNVRSGRELLISDHAGEFSNACYDILSDPELGMRMAEVAREQYIRNWTWSAMAPRVGKVLEHGAGGGNAGATASNEL